MTAKLTPLKPYEPNWPHGYCTRDGRPARLLGSISNAAFPLVFAIVVRGTDGVEMTLHTRRNGREVLQREGPGDLMCVAPQRPDHRYVFIVEDTAGRLSAPWPSRQRAQQHIDECDERFPELSPRKVLRFVQDMEDVA